MSELPEGVEYVDVADARLDLEPGDHLVIRGDLDPEERAAIKAALLEQLEIDVNVIVIPADVELSVVRQVSRQDYVTRAELLDMLAEQPEIA